MDDELTVPLGQVKHGEPVVGHVRNAPKAPKGRRS